MSLCSLSIHPRSTAFESTLSVHQSSSMSLPFDPETYLKWKSVTLIVLRGRR